MNLSFFGAAGTVTGSRFLLEADGQRLLIDCGLFQGLKQLRLRNWATFPVAPSSIDADETMRWLRNFQRPPKKVFLVHGEPEAADTLRLRIKDQLGWSCHVAEHLQTAELP